MRVKLVSTAAILTIALVAGFVVLPGSDLSAQTSLFPYDDPAAVAAGEVLYEENCASCHGIDLKGQPDWRGVDGDGFLPAPPHDGDGHTWHHPDTLLFMITKFGTAAMVGGDYKSNMSGYDGVLSDDQILQTLAYIKSTWSPRLIEMHNTVNENANLAGN
ncbi:MAG: cytochrome C [Marinosulfonomonas sp.]|nr:MAG: cytochrome C [Marinosulfonomonas sp.]